MVDGFGNVYVVPEGAQREGGEHLFPTLSSSLFLGNLTLAG
jgi:hypothetical protein